MAWIFFRSRIHDAHYPVSILADSSQLSCPRVYPVQDPSEVRQARAEFRSRRLPSRHREPRSAPAQQLLPRKCGLGRFDSLVNFSFGSQFPLDEFFVLHHARRMRRPERFLFGKFCPSFTFRRVTGIPPTPPRALPASDIPIRSSRPILPGFRRLRPVPGTLRAPIPPH